MRALQALAAFAVVLLLTVLSLELYAIRMLAAGLVLLALTWPLLIVVDEVDPHTRCAKHSRRVGEFASFEEYAAWLHAEYDDGTIRWDE